ncbi:hypothetical protein ACRAWB_05355 [Leifsonia poae]|uniref:hypothetical protein n=1 Tax=Leifsonia poae TaxID=110933 RepID=UPI003D69B3B9
MAEQGRAAPSERRTASARVLLLTRLAWIAVLLVTTLFHVVRGAPVDAWIYGLGAAALVLDQLRWLRIPLRLRSDRDRLSRRIVAGVLIAVAALTVAVTPLYGPADTAIVVGLGVLLLPVVWADRPAGAAEATDASSRPVRRAAVLWSAVIAAGCAWEIGAFFLGRDLPAHEQDFPALSDLMDPVLAWQPARGVLVALWLLGGYALIRRGRRR